MISVRQIIVGLGLAFTAYLAARGLWWTAPVPEPLVVIAALVLYLVTTWLCIFWERRRPTAPGVDGADAGPMSTASRTTLPSWAGVLALASAFIVPSAIAVAVAPDDRTAPFATWYLGGIGALMTIVMVRRRPWIAWIGITALAVASMAWMGPLTALNLGLVGSIVWVAATQLMLLSIDRAASDTAQLAQLQRAASAWQARLAEGRLRDEMRGPRLLDDAVHAELERARRRGTNVTVLDEGGLDGLDEATLAIIRTELAETLRSARSDRLYIRTSPDDRVAVTVVGRSATGPGLSDEDAVDLWREIGHPGAA